MAHRFDRAVFGLVLATTAGLLAIWPPFLMPPPLYALVHGWRYPRSWSCGGFTITDEGPAAAAHRYTADLGTLPLHDKVSRTYTLCGLPADDFVVGLVLPSSADVANVHVSMRIFDEKGRVMAIHSGSLASDWRWARSGTGPAFVYGTDTYLDVRWPGSYEISVTVAGDASPIPRLVLHGGGWK